MKEKLPKNHQAFVVPSVLRSKVQYFPSIFRLFPEVSLELSKIIVPVKIIVILGVTALLIYATVKQAKLLQSNREYLNKIVLKRKSVEKELEYWQKVAEKYNNYPDAKLKIAELEYSLGYGERAKETINKVLTLNPDMEMAQVLGEWIRRR